MRLRRRPHEHKWLPMGAVSFTEYSTYNQHTSSHDAPSLIWACRCGAWNWQRLYMAPEKQRWAA